MCTLLFLYWKENIEKCHPQEVSKINFCPLHPLSQASVQFAECQCIIQCQEQAAMRFRLQHTLDVKVSTLLKSMAIKLDAFTLRPNFWLQPIYCRVLSKVYVLNPFFTWSTSLLYKSCS